MRLVSSFVQELVEFGSKAVARCRWPVPEIRHVIYIPQSLVAGDPTSRRCTLLRKLCTRTHDSDERIEDFFAQSAYFRQSARLHFRFRKLFYT